MSGERQSNGALPTIGASLQPQSLCPSPPLPGQASCLIQSSAQHAVQPLRLGLACRWAAVPGEDWPQDRAQRNIILGDFDMATQYGDRRQVSQSPHSGQSHAALPQILCTPGACSEWWAPATQQLTLCAGEMRAPMRQTCWTLRPLVLAVCRPDTGAAASGRGDSTQLPVMLSSLACTDWLPVLWCRS